MKRKWFAYPYILWMALFIIIPMVLRSIKKKKMEVEAYERNQVTK